MTSQFAFRAIAALPRWRSGAARACQAWCRRLRHESFAHFLLLGALIFGAQALLGRKDGAERQIVVTAAERAYLRAQFSGMWGREPDAAGMRQLVRDWVREEVQYREALALGLDRDDVIIRRRLMQKMDFLATADAREPTEAEIDAYYRSHLGAYEAGAGVSFTQRYFSPDSRGERAAADASAALTRLQSGAAVAGDPFTLPAAAVQAPRDTLVRDYGTAFASALASAPVGAWFGPVRSSYGWHLLRVDARRNGVPAPLAAVRDRVRADLVNQGLNAARETSFQRLLDRYKVTGLEQTEPASPAGAPR